MLNRKALPGSVGIEELAAEFKRLAAGSKVLLADDLDFLSVHHYPKKGKVAEALKRRAGPAVAKPIGIEETFRLKCPMADFEEFIDT